MNYIQEFFKYAGVYKLGETVIQIKSSEEFVNGKPMSYVKKCSPSYWDTSLFKKLQKGQKNAMDVLVCV